MLDVVCIKAGDAFGPEYVNRLAAGVRRHLRLPHRFVCLTDDPGGIAPGIFVLPLDEPGLDGWWHKLTLFKPPRGLGERRVLFMDLDTIITGDLDGIASYGGPFCLLRDFYRPEGYGSGLMSIAPGFGRGIWESFDAGRAGAIEACGWHGDQAWIERCVRGADLWGPQAASRLGCPDLWQEILPGQAVSYKVHARERVPEGARVVCFHGRPRPHEVGEGWVRDAWID